MKSDLDGRKQFAPDPPDHEPAHDGENFFDQFDDEAAFELRNSPGWAPTPRERFMENALDAMRWSVTPAIGRFLERRNLATGGENRQAARRQQGEELDFEQMAPADTLLEYMVATGGQIAGAALDPVNFLYAPIRFLSASLRASRPVLAQAIEEGVSTSAVGAAIDVSVQGVRVASGAQEGFDPRQTLASGGLGLVLGSGGGAFAARVGGVQPNYFDRFDGEPARPAATPEGQAAARDPDAAAPAVDVQAEPAPAAAPEIEGAIAPPAAEPVPEFTASVGAEIPATDGVRDAGGQEGLSFRLASGGQARRTSAPSGRDPAGVAVGTAPAAPRLEDLIERLTEAAPDPTAFRKGRITNPKAAGTFNPRSGVVRARDVTDLQTITHEIAHAHEARHGKRLADLKKQHRGELEPMAYAGARQGTELSEGFAEFVRYYVSNPAYALQQAPTFVPAFERFMAFSAPRELAALHDARAGYQAWLAAPSGGQVARDIVSERRRGAITEARAEVSRHGLRAALGNWAHELYTATFDRLHPIDQAVQELLRVHAINKGQRVDIKAADHAYKLARLAVDSGQAGMVDLMHGVVPYRGVEPEGPALFDALELALGRGFAGGWDHELTREFGAYLVSRRALVEYDRYLAGEIPNPPGKFTRGDYELARAEFEAAHPEWADAADLVYSFQQLLLEKKHAAGFLTDEQLALFSEKPDYVPFMRDMRDFGAEVGVDPPPGRAGQSRTGKSAIVQAFRGSNRAIINPLESIMRDAISTATLIARNDVFRALDALAVAAGPGGGTIVERIPNRQLKATTVPVAEVMAAAGREQGLDPRDVQALTGLADELFGENATGTVFRAGDINERGEPIVYVWRNGERQALRLADGEFGRSLYGALTGLSKEHSSMLVHLMTLPATALRMGVTTHPEFLFANFIRDQVTAWILSPDGFIPGVSGARGIAAELAGGDLARMYGQAGGLFGGANVSAVHNARVRRDLNALARKGFAIQTVTSFEGLMRASELSETGTRLGLFEAAFKRARGQGLSEHEALMEAAYSARDYIDFGRHGSKLLIARRLIPFFNASLQGLDKGYRTMVHPFVKYRAGQALTASERANLGLAAKAWAKTATIGLVGLGLTALYRDDPEYQEISDYTRATHWMVKIGGGRWLAVPKPFEFAVLSNIFERGFEAAYHDDPLAWERMREGLGDIFIPPLDATAPSLIAELRTNYDFFGGRPIVPQNLRGLEPRLQFNAYTSQFARALGDAVNVSPMYVDHAITGVGGSWGRQILNWSNRAQANAPPAELEDGFITRRFVKHVARGSTSSRRFWDLMARDGGEWETVKQTYQELTATGAAGKADAYLAGKPEDAVAYALINEHFPASIKRLHPMRRGGDAVRVISNARQEISLDGFQLAETEKPAALPGSVKGAADTILSMLAMIEYRNALIGAGARGWKARKLMDTKPVWAELEAASPAVAAEMRARYESARIYDEAAVRATWPEARRRLLADRADALLDDLVP